MHLINVHTLELESFSEGNIPRYCILSHRWSDDEVTFKEFRKGTKRSGEGYRKIVEFCKFVKHMDLHWDCDKENLVERRVHYGWVDTCKRSSESIKTILTTCEGCIDKRSSAELSEAINSVEQGLRTYSVHR